MNVKTDHIFIYIIPGFYLILNVMIILHLFDYLPISKVIESVNIGSSVLIILLSMIVGYINHIPYYIIMGHNINELKMFFKSKEYSTGSKRNRINDILYGYVIELKAFGSLFVSVVIIIIIFTLLIFIDQSNINKPIATIQLLVNFFVLIGLWKIIKKKNNILRRFV